MKAQLKLLMAASIATLGVSSFANASINVSMETVCLKANATTLEAEKKQSDATVKDSRLMSQHFAVMTCNGKQLLENTHLEHASLLLPKLGNKQLVSSND